MGKYSFEYSIVVVTGPVDGFFSSPIPCLKGNSCTLYINNTD